MVQGAELTLLRGGGPRRYWRLRVVGEGISGLGFRGLGFRGLGVSFRVNDLGLR